MKKKHFVVRSITIAVVVVYILLASGCGGDKELQNSDSFKSVVDLTSTDLEAISKRSYYFGHQSVGENILHGLEMLMKDYPPLKLNIVKSEDPNLIKPGNLLHSRIGKNKEPASKISAFEKIMEDGMGGNVDAALLKFCYVDANRDSNAKELFENYKKSIEALKTKYPETQFVHFTMPVRSVPGVIKVNIMNILGKEVTSQLDNVVRGEYNDLLRKEYRGKEPVFDIAFLESIEPRRQRSVGFMHGNKRYESLADQYSYDGGHLSDEGKRWIAEQLVIFLASLSSQNKISNIQ